MNLPEILLIVAAIAILFLDVVVRLILTPHRRDRLVEDLLNVLHEPGPNAGHEPESPATLLPAESLGEGLLRHFAHSSLSCRILQALAASDHGLRQKDIATAVNTLLREKHRHPLPEVALRKVLLTLLGSGFVTVREGALELTPLGRHLHRALDEHRHDAYHRWHGPFQPNERRTAALAPNPRISGGS